jgi:uncharacterized cofD-like protein
VILTGQLPRNASRRPRIAAIGGGTGLPVVLEGLRSVLLREGIADSGSLAEHLTAIVTVTDDGGSSGQLRRQLDVLPPGDIRNCLAALAEAPAILTNLLQHRFNGANDLHGHTVGNLMLVALAQMTGDFPTAVRHLAEFLHVNGSVLPSTAENVHLRAEFVDGETAGGEMAIVAQAKRIKRLWLAREVRPLPDTVRALINADAIVVGPGSLYTSILPNLLVGGIASTISGVKAVRIYVANLMSEPGETDGYSLEDHLRTIREHVGVNLFDYVLVNRAPIDEVLASQYARRGSMPIQYDRSELTIGRMRVIERDLAWEVSHGKIRHAPGDLARAILELLQLGRPASHQVADSPAPHRMIPEKACDQYMEEITCSTPTGNRGATL